MALKIARRAYLPERAQFPYLKGRQSYRDRLFPRAASGRCIRCHCGGGQGRGGAPTPAWKSSARTRRRLPVSAANRAELDARGALRGLLRGLRYPARRSGRRATSSATSGRGLTSSSRHRGERAPKVRGAGARGGRTGIRPLPWRVRERAHRTRLEDGTRHRGVETEPARPSVPQRDLLLPQDGGSGVPAHP